MAKDDIYNKIYIASNKQTNFTNSVKLTTILSHIWAESDHLIRILWDNISSVNSTDGRVASRQNFFRKNITAIYLGDGPSLYTFADFFLTF